jgi:hypothetical protein
MASPAKNTKDFVNIINPESELKNAIKGQPWHLTF